eukprot:7302759-Pyramimonas_sp.AAC.1
MNVEGEDRDHGHSLCKLERLLPRTLGVRTPLASIRKIIIRVPGARSRVVMVRHATATARATCILATASK